jgi:methanogenic corrinoid protein MtbC1
MGSSNQPNAFDTRLTQALADLQENDVMEIVRLRIDQGDDPLQIIEDCQAALILAGDILREIMETVLPAVEGKYVGQSAGRVLLGTVQGDIHDLGKNLVTMLLRSYGFMVLDLGVDVPPARFVEEARTFKPHVIGMSGLITTAYASMRDTVSALRAMMAEDGIQVPIMLGGQVDEQVCRYVNADYWTTDAMEGVRLCQRLVGAR